MNYASPRRSREVVGGQRVQDLAVARRAAELDLKIRNAYTIAAHAVEQAVELSQVVTRLTSEYPDQELYGRRLEAVITAAVEDALVQYIAARTNTYGQY